jgi:chromosome segregation ATPase
VSTETTKAMQEALEAAVTRMNSGSAPEPHVPSQTEMLGALMGALPKLLRGDESGEELIERIDTLQKTELTPLREQVQMLRRQCHRIAKAQEALLARVEELQREQATASEAVLDLARQMERITFVEDIPSEGGYGRQPPHAPGSCGRAHDRMGGNGRGRSDYGA